MADRYGIYFNMPEDEYHADPAIGSTDLRRLLASGPDYWWSSPLNPQREQRETPALAFGKAMHRFVLEGRQAFASQFIRRPDEVTRMTPKIREELCKNGEKILEGDDYDRILISGGQIAKNPDLASAFEGGMPEVSCFWEHLQDDGAIIRCKARFDYLKIRGVGDLKSIRNMYGRPFGEACTRAIVEYRYDIQAAHYLEGRSHLPHFVADNHVHGDYDAGWLRRVAAAKAFAFMWVFYQAEGAPITWSRSLSPGNPILQIAGRDRDKALATFAEYRAAFGTTTMWLLRDQVSELEINALPSWYK
jgi:PDDEXK-like domain of unknown function (DUF3799)